MDLKDAINALVHLDRELSKASTENILSLRKARDETWAQIFEEIDQLKAKKFPNDIMPYLPTRISGYVFSDGYSELWCFSRDEDRVFHIGAELEIITNQKEWGKDYDNGFYAHNLKMAFEEVSKNVGD
jgi:hypothetical protein